MQLTKPEITNKKSENLKEILNAVKSKIINSGSADTRVNEWGFPLNHSKDK